VPEDRERSAVRRRPVEQRVQPWLGALRRQAEVALLRQRGVHRCERDLEHVGRRFVFEVPGVERPREAGAKPDRVREAERRVVAERQLRHIPVRVAAEVVVAVAGDGPGKGLELRLLLGEARRIVGGRVAAVQPDLGAGLPQCLDELRPELVVRLGRRAVVRIVVSREHEERGTLRAVAPLLRDDLLETPVRVGAAHTVHGRRDERGGLAERRRKPNAQHVPLQPRGRPAHADARPAPRVVDVVREGDAERAVGEAELRAQPLQRRVERIETRPLGPKTAVLVVRARALFDAG